jgi:hypothetical protein
MSIQSFCPAAQGDHPSSSWSVHPTYAPQVLPQAQRLGQLAQPIYYVPVPQPTPHNTSTVYHAASAPSATPRPKATPHPPKRQPTPSQPSAYLTDETYCTITEVRYPEEVYTRKEASIMLTNLSVIILENQVSRPLQAILGQSEIPQPPQNLDPRIAQRIQQVIINPVLSNLPQQEEKFDDLWMKETINHIVNIFFSKYHQEAEYIKKAMQAITPKSTTKPGGELIFQKNESFVAGLAYEVNRMAFRIINGVKINC